MIVKTGRQLLVEKGFKNIIGNLYPFLSEDVRLVTEEEKIYNIENADYIIKNENDSERKTVISDNIICDFGNFLATDSNKLTVTCKIESNIER